MFRKLLQKTTPGAKPIAEDIVSLRGHSPDTRTLHSLVCALVFSIEESDAVVRRPDRTGRGEVMSANRTTLIFLPTYRSLEDLHGQLEAAQGRYRKRLRLCVLHSSVDLDECLRAMEDDGGDALHKVILATNVAESSLTIPGVSTVIDYCRANQIHCKIVILSRFACHPSR